MISNDGLETVFEIIDICGWNDYFYLHQKACSDIFATNGKVDFGFYWGYRMSVCHHISDWIHGTNFFATFREFK